MERVEDLLEFARKHAGPQRVAAIADLKKMASDDDSRHEAVGGLITLWQDSFATPADLAPYATTVTEIWQPVFESVKPFQQEIVKVEWVMDEEYAPVSSEAECLLALMGYLQGEEVGRRLRDALQTLTDPSLKMVAVLSLLRRLDPVPSSEIESVAASHLVRIHLWERLQDLGMESLMPLQWASPEALAASELARWLSHPNELNAIPEEIELMRSFPVTVQQGGKENVYLFRFREFPKPWEPGEGWMAGIAGPYCEGEWLGSPWSAFRRWDSKSPEEHVKEMYHS